MTDNALTPYQRKKNYKKKGMIISSINVNGSLNDIDEIKPLVNEGGIHILAINETKLDNEILNGIIYLDNFDLRRKGCNRFGGGVAIYIETT